MKTPSSSRIGLPSDGKAPEFKPFTGGLDNQPLGADDTLLFTKILDDQIKLEVEKLRSSANLRT